jgi:hypothetical protein
LQLKSKYNKLESNQKAQAKAIKRLREKGYFKDYLSSEHGKKLTKKYNKNRREKNHKITEKEWYNCKLYFNFRCAYCGKTWEDNFVETGKDLHKEHVIDEGRNDIKNCVPSCNTCNTQKNTKTLNEWYNTNNSIYSYERYLKIYQFMRYDYKKYIHKKKPKGKYTKKNKEYWSKFDK